MKPKKLPRPPIYFAEGGEVEDEQPEEEDASELTEEAPVEAVAADDPDEVEVIEPEEEVVEEEAPKLPSRPKKDASDDNTIVVTGHKRPMVPVTAQELDNENALFAQDMARGHIKPETMHSLYGKQDTLGKIGTLFGLLVSGMGSGLTGQPNAVLEMMKNQINNDLEAQKASNMNAQNWLRLSQQHELNKAQLTRYGVENELTRAQIGKIPSEITQMASHTKNMDADTNLKSVTAAKTRMSLAALKYLQDQVGKMPDGPNKQNAEGVLANVVTPAVAQDAATANAQTAAQINARAALTGNLPPSVPPGVDMKKLQLLKAAGEAAHLNGVPIMPGQGLDPHEAQTATKEAGFVNKNRAAYGTIKNAFEELDKQAFGGSLNKKNYNVIQSHVVGQLISSGMTKDEAHDLASSMLPKWDDLNMGKANTRATKATQMWEQFKTQEVNTPTLDMYGLKTAFPGPPQISMAKADKRGAAKATPKAAAPKAKSGRQIIMKDGKPFYK